jgi:carboxyvinyl-carboxyphosphonate phosphorylmutase
MGRDSRRERFRAVLAGSACLHPASVFDPISARIAEDLGFELGMFAGSIASMTVLGAPDIIVLTLSEFAAQIRRISRAGSLPLLVDADHGYGNALNVMRTVEELEVAGVAALTIEDTDLPTPFAATEARLIPLEEGVGKMRAALAARQDSALAIIGRTSAMAIAGEAEAVSRVKAYEQAGVDAVFLTGVKTREQLAAVQAATRLPILLGGTEGELTDRAVLAAHGVRVALQGHQPFLAAIQAVHDTLKALRAGAQPSGLAGLASGELVKQVTRGAEYARRATDYLGG